MLASLSNYWWLFVFRGVLGLLFGVAAFAYSNATIMILLYFFAAFVMVEGSFIAVASLDFRTHNEGWWVYLVTGAAGVIFGSLTLFNPDASLTGLISLVTIWALALCAIGLVAAFSLRKEIQSEWALLMASLVSLLFGIALLLHTEIGATAMVWIMGAYASIFGRLMLLFGIRIKAEAREKIAHELTNAMR